MTFAAGAVRMGRRQAEALMESTCAITRALTGTVNPATGVRSGDTSSSVYSGVCRFRFKSSAVGTPESGDRGLTAQMPELSLPVEGSAGVQVGDLVTITGNPLDVGVVGLTLRVTGTHFQTHSTARRLQVQVLS